MSDDIDELVDWQLSDSPAARHHARSTRPTPPASMPYNISPYYVPDSRVVDIDGSGE